MAALFTVLVGGVAVGIAPGSLNITEVLKQRATASFKIPETTQVREFPVGSPVSIVDSSAVTRFGGTISKPLWRVPSGTGARFWEITCIDWNQLADKRLCAERSWTNKPLGEIVRDIIVFNLNGEGLDLSEVQDGPTIASFTTTGDKYCNQEFDRLAITAAAQTGAPFQWNIDFSKHFRFFSHDTYTTPVVLTGDLCRANSIKGWETRDGYFNSVIVRFRFAGDSSFAVAIAEDTTEILARIAIEGGSGLYQKVVTLPDPATFEEAQEVADATLASSKDIARVITFDTDEPSYRLGQFFDVDIPGYGTVIESLSFGIDLDDGLDNLSDEALLQSLYDRFRWTYLARSVRTYDEQAQRLYRTIEGISGAIPQDYVDWFRGLRDKGTAAIQASDDLVIAYA